MVFFFSSFIFIMSNVSEYNVHYYYGEKMLQLHKVLKFTWVIFIGKHEVFQKKIVLLLIFNYSFQ